MVFVEGDWEQGPTRAARIEVRCRQDALRHGGLCLNARQSIWSTTHNLCAERQCAGSRRTMYLVPHREPGPQIRIRRVPGSAGRGVTADDGAWAQICGHHVLAELADIY